MYNNHQSPALRHLGVETLWHYTDYRPRHAYEHVFPSGTVELIILPGDSWRPDRSVGLEPIEGGWQPGFVVGPYARPFMVDTRRQQCCMGAHISIGFASVLFDLQVADIRERHIGLEQLWGAGARSLQQRISDGSSPQQRLRVLEQHLLKSASRPDGPPSFLAPCLDRLRRFPRQRIDSLVALSGYSERHFIASFHQHVGLAPKSLQRILRFQQATRLLRASRASLASIALDCGYCDQAHLHRELQALGGRTPSQYRLDSAQSGIPEPERGQICPIPGILSHQDGPS